jgi:NAD(P)-dependent dehydrogenase (short-subunit alcohol dehydrogenase family)
MSANSASPRLTGKVAIVTGGLSGIGAAVSRRLVSEGARVVAADLSVQDRMAENGSATLNGVEPVPLDVGDAASVAECFAAVVARHGRMDILINSAGVGRDIPFLETPVEEFDRIVAVNLRGTFLVGQAAARHMVQGGGGAIVNIASVSGLRGIRGRAAYGASKGGVVTLSQVMAVELAMYGIRVNVIAPGPVETPLVAAIHTDAIRQDWLRQIPMRSYGTPDEIAGVAAFLCSDDASYVTGHVLAADGGFLAAGITMPRE